MNPALVEVAERLAAQFPDEPSTAVIRILTECVDEFPDSDLMFVEQAAHARLTHGG